MEARRRAGKSLWLEMTPEHALSLLWQVRDLIVEGRLDQKEKDEIRRACAGLIRVIEKSSLVRLG